MEINTMLNLGRAAKIAGNVACVYFVAWYLGTFFGLLRVHEDGFGYGPEHALSQASRGAIALTAAIICAMSLALHALMAGGADAYEPKRLSLYLRYFGFVFVAMLVHNIAVLALLCESIAQDLNVPVVAVGVTGGVFILAIGGGLLGTYFLVYRLQKQILTNKPIQGGQIKDSKPVEPSLPR